MIRYTILVVHISQLIPVKYWPNLYKFFYIDDVEKGRPTFINDIFDDF